MNGDEHGPAALNMVKVRLEHYTERHVEVDGDAHGPAAFNMVKVRLEQHMERMQHRLTPGPVHDS